MALGICLVGTLANLSQVRGIEWRMQWFVAINAGANVN
jgi:hypothetical protein